MALLKGFLCEIHSAEMTSGFKTSVLILIVSALITEYQKTLGY